MAKPNKRRLPESVTCDLMGCCPTLKSVMMNTVLKSVKSLTFPFIYECNPFKNSD